MFNILAVASLRTVSKGLGCISRRSEIAIESGSLTFELGRSGDLRIVRTLRASLSARDDDSPALFPSQKADRMTPKAITDVVEQCARRAEVRPFEYGDRGDPGDVSAHTLWHSVAWRMLRAEEENTLYDVRNRLRHATILTTERKYDHFQTI